MTMTTDEELEFDSVTDELRQAVYRRDNYRCRRCGEMDTAKLTLHHVIYRSQRGGHYESNLCTVCWTCHTLIHDKKVIVKMVKGRWFFGTVGDYRRRL